MGRDTGAARVRGPGDRADRAGRGPHPAAAEPGARDRAATSARDIASLVLTVHAALIEMTLADAGFAGREPGGNGR